MVCPAVTRTVLANVIKKAFTISEFFNTACQLASENSSVSTIA